MLEIPAAFSPKRRIGRFSRRKPSAPKLGELWHLAVMEVTPHAKSGLDDWTENFTRSLHRQRDRVGEFLAAQRARLNRAETVLADRLEALAEQLDREHVAIRQSHHDLETQRQELADESASLAHLRRQLDARAQEVEALASATGSASALAAQSIGRTPSPLEQILQKQEESEDLRELRVQNAELQNLVNRLRAEGQPSPAGATLDWEAEKRRILAALEQEDAGTPEFAAYQDAIQKIVERTDRILGDKDRLLVEKDHEIAELKTLLENQSTSVGQMAVGAAALGEMFDGDALICEQRENLKQLQEDVQKKLREAEVEISLERAKIARERSQFEERLRRFEEQAGIAAVGSLEDAVKNPSPRNRWLSRLGLKEEDRNR